MSWYRRLFNLARPNRVTRDLDREIAHHLAEKKDTLMNEGMSERDAAAEARRRFGNATAKKEQTRDVDVLTWADSVFTDVRYAFRALRRSPAFAMVAILSLALGIGANTAIFSLINAVMLKSLPVQHPEQLAAVKTTDGNEVLTNPIWEQIRDHQDAFAGVFATSSTQFDLTAGGEVRRAAGEYVSGDYFGVLGVRPALGRLIVHGDDVRGCRAIAVLSQPFWQSEFGGDEHAIGKQIALGGKSFEIVGVADPAFFGMTVGNATQVFAPLCSEAVIRESNIDLDHRARWWLTVTGRMKSGVTAEETRSRLKALSPTVFSATVPEIYSSKGQQDYLKNTLDAQAQPAGISDLRNSYKSALYTLMVVVAVVLLIACGNVANLLLARARARQREAAVRLAVGAGRGRLVRQLLTESLVLAAIGAGTGVLLARWGTRLLVSLLSTSSNRVWLDLTVDRRMLAFTIATAVLTGVLFGIAPALRAANVDPQSAMRGAGRGITSERKRFSLARSLVMAQVALSLTLLIGAGLLLGSFQRLTSIDVGFRGEGVLIVRADLSRAGYAEDARLGVHDAIIDRLQAIPGVKSVSTADIVPLSNMGWNDQLIVDGFTPKSDRDDLVFFNAVSAEYFNTLGIARVAGRTFESGDRVATQPVAVINESVAKKFFPGKNPVGQSFHTMQGDKATPTVQIVGVVKDSKYRSVREDHSETVYLAASQDAHPRPSVSFAIRAAGSPGTLIPGVRAAMSAVNGAISYNFSTLDAVVSASLARSRLLATLSAFFGALALVLAIVGLYGTMAYSVERRRNEIGIRIALGAARTRVVALVLGEAGWMVAGGLVAGSMLALGATRWVSSLLYGVTPTDAVTYILASALLAVVAVAASAIPAWRAARLDPVETLREE